MKNNYEAISNLKGKISEKDFNSCINDCPNVIEIDGILYCTNKTCRSHKKRVNTRMKNIIKRSKWNEVQNKLNLAENKLFDDPIFPYIVLESIIQNIYDDEIRVMLANRIGVSVSKLRTEGVNKIYSINRAEIKSILEITVLKKLGLKRAEQIIKNRLRG